ncbi:AAA family ATPase [candidate division WOR-3 bacterium]|nr:AAA family ATPase [candidate division WOR-3 bacterium]
MIKSIRIKNIATIKNVEILFDKGLNIITGETGAGKSLIFDAVSLALALETGRRSFKNSGYSTEVSLILEDSDGSVNVVEVKLPKKGKIERALNGKPLQADDVRLFSLNSVMMFGQNKMSELLGSEHFHEYLDYFSQNDFLLRSYAEFYEEYKNLNRELSRLLREKETDEERKKLAEYELEELNGISPKQGEWDELNSAIKKLENFEYIKLHLKSCEEITGSSENSMFSQIKQLRNEVIQLARIDSAYDELNDLVNQLSLVRDELDVSLSKFSDFEFDTETLSSLRERRDILHRAIKKFGGTFENMMKRADELRDFLSSSFVTAENIEKVRQTLKSVEKKVLELLEEISSKRKINSAVLTEEISRMLESLGFKEARFDVRVEDKKKGEYNINGILFDETGRDDVDFLFSANPDISMKSLHKVVSGGELSRIALAIQTITMKKRLLPVVVFDEIDIGISGKTARAVGKYLSLMSSSRQVIVITHLPQIASLADHYIEVQKSVSAKKSETFVQYANGKEDRIRAVASLASGKALTKEAMEYAESLIESK